MVSPECWSKALSTKWTTGGEGIVESLKAYMLAGEGDKLHTLIVNVLRVI